MGLGNLGRNLALGAALVGCGDPGAHRTGDLGVSDVDSGPSIFADGGFKPDSAIVDAGSDVPAWEIIDAALPAVDGAVNDIDAGVSPDFAVSPDAALLDAALPPQVTGTIEVTRCALFPSGVVIASPDNRSSQRVDMDAVAVLAVAGQTSNVNTACFQVLAHFDQPDGELVVPEARVSLNGSYFDLPTKITWGDDIEAPFGQRNSGGRIQPTNGALTLRSDEPVVVRVEHRLGDSDHSNDFYSAPYLSLIGGEGVEVNCYDRANEFDGCSAPPTAFTNSNNYRLIPRYYFGDRDQIVPISTGPQVDPVVIGRWDVLSDSAAFGAVSAIDVDCVDIATDLPAPVNGDALIEVRNSDYQLVDVVMGGALEDGHVEMIDGQPVEIFPGDTLNLNVRNSDLNVSEGTEVDLKCDIMNVAFASQDAVLDTIDPQNQRVNWSENDNSWNLVTNRALDEGGPGVDNFFNCYLDGERQPVTWDNYSQYLWSGNTDLIWDPRDDHAGERIHLPLDETRTFSWNCNNNGEVKTVDSLRLRVWPTDFDEAYDFGVEVVVDGGAGMIVNQVHISPNDNGTPVDVDVQLPLPINVVNNLEFRLRPLDGAVDFPQTLNDQPYFFVERPNLKADLEAISAHGADGGEFPIEYHTVVQISENANGEPVYDNVFVDLNDPDRFPTKPVQVEFATPWSLISVENNNRPVLVDPNSQEAIEQGVVAWEGLVSNYYDGGKLLRMDFLHNNPGKVALGRTIVEVQVGGNTVVVPANNWNGNGFSIVLDPSANVPFSSGIAAVTNDPDVALRYTNIRVVLRSDFDGFENGLTFALQNMVVIAGSDNQEVDIGTRVANGGDVLVPVNTAELTGPPIVFSRN